MARDDRDRSGQPRALDPALRPPPSPEFGEGGFGVSIAVFPLFVFSTCLAVFFNALYPGNVPLIAAPPVLGAATVAWLFRRHSIEGRIRYRTRALNALLVTDAREVDVGRELLRITPAPPVEAERREPLAVAASRFLRRALPPPAPSRGFEGDPDDDLCARGRATLRALHDQEGITFADGLFMVPLVNKPTGRGELRISTRWWFEGLAFIERFADRQAAWLVSLALTETDPTRFGALLAEIDRRALDRAWAGRFVERALAHDAPLFRWHTAAALGRLAPLEAMLTEGSGCDSATADALLRVAWRATGDDDAITRWSRHPTPVVRGAVAALPDVPMPLVMALLRDESAWVAARFIQRALDGPPVLDRVRAVLDRPDRFDGGVRVEGVTRALDRVADSGQPSDLSRVVRWLGAPGLDAAARRARDVLRARFADAIGAGGLALSSGDHGGELALAADPAGELSLADDTGNGRR